MSSCFAPWILTWWSADEKRLALGLDATTLKKRFTVLCVRVLYRGCALLFKKIGLKRADKMHKFVLDY